VKDVTIRSEQYTSDRRWKISLANRWTVKIRLLTFSVLVLALLWFPARGALQEKKDRPDVRTPILLYHRFGPVVADSMTVTTSVFESHLKYVKDNGYVVIPLRQLVDYYLGKGAPPPSRSVVIVSDDGHKSVYTDMFPLIKKYRIPVTLFIYPSAISNASYAMTWDQLKEMKKTGLIDFESHTYWHPNFKKERRRLNADEYEKFVKMQLRKSKEKLEKEFGGKVDMLAWPFGIYDDDLIQNAREAGYVAAFTIERRHTSTSDSLLTLPRYLMTDADRGKVFERIMAGASPQRKPAY